ncbi:uncharacterized protein METZ01_LOCUS16800, partial [marine metagenome]
VVLIRDVHIHTRVHVVTDVDAVVANDRTAAPDQASIANDHHGISHHLLPRQHSRRQGDLGGNHGVIADAYPSFPVHVPCRPTDD